MEENGSCFGAATGFASSNVPKSPKPSSFAVANGSAAATGWLAGAVLGADSKVPKSPNPSFAAV